MLSFRQALSPDQHEALANGSLQIKTQKYAGHHAYKGGKDIVSLSEALKIDLCSVQSTYAQVPDQPCSFLCPRGHPRSSDSQFDSYNVSKSIWCASCKGCHAATAWQCPCKIAWHNCPIHFVYPACAVQNCQRSTALGTKRPAAVNPETSARSLRRLEPSIATRACLGPRLAARFPHLASESEQPQHIHNTARTDPGTPNETGPRAHM